MENDKTLHDWINKTITEEDLNEFKKRADYDDLDQLFKTTEGMQPPGFDKDAMLKEILADAKKENQVEAKTRRLPKWLPLLAAASIVLMLTFLFYPRNNVVQLSTLYNEQQSKALPDGSTLTLYANSKLNYNQSDWSKARQLHLTGSAKFEVTKGKPFTVSTNYGKVEVLGTIFTANTEGQILEVICTEGKVRVTNINKNLSDEIVKNESIKMIDNEAMIVNKEGFTKIENASLYLALNELTKVFNVTFDVIDVNVMDVITANFQHNNFSNAIKTVLNPLNIKYEVNGKVVRLTK